MSDLISRLGDELKAAAERQAEARRRRLGGRWSRRPGRALALTCAAVALAGAGGAAGLLAERGTVGGPPSLTHARLTPEQTAAGLRERTRPVVIGRGRLPISRREWQLVAFQTTRGLCIAIDFPAVANMGGGCGSARPREGREVDWQGYLSALGRRSPSALLGAVSPGTARVLLTYDVRAGRVGKDATLVRVSDPRVLRAIEVEAPFAYYVGEVEGANPWARATALAAGGRRLGVAGVPNGGAGSAGFVPAAQTCEQPEIDSFVVRDAAIPLGPRARAAFAPLRRSQRRSDRPSGLVRRLMHGSRWAYTSAMMDVAGMRRLADGPNGRARYLVAWRSRLYVERPGCLRTTTPRLRAIERRNDRAARREAARVHLSLVNERGRPLQEVAADDLHHRHGYGYSGSSQRAVIRGLLPDRVATIELTFRGGVRRLATVRGNVFELEVPFGLDGGSVTRQLWRDRQGRAIYRGRFR